MENELENFNTLKRIDFQIGEEPYVYKDSWVISQEEYDKLSEEEILAFKQARYDRWYNYITTEPSLVETTDVMIEEVPTEEII
jgi:hypothetical protein